jgi:hypothetical protein
MEPAGSKKLGASVSLQDERLFTSQKGNGCIPNTSRRELPLLQVDGGNWWNIETAMTLRIKITIHFVWNISSSTCWPVVHSSQHYSSGSLFKIFLICKVYHFASRAIWYCLQKNIFRYLSFAFCSWFSYHGWPPLSSIAYMAYSLRSRFSRVRFEDSNMWELYFCPVPRFRSSYRSDDVQIWPLCFALGLTYLSVPLFLVLSSSLHFFDMLNTVRVYFQILFYIGRLWN